VLKAKHPPNAFLPDDNNDIIIILIIL